jgi:hypothetical protein
MISVNTDIANFQGNLLEILAATTNGQETLEAIGFFAQASASDFHGSLDLLDSSIHRALLEYISIADPVMLEVASELVKKWGVIL